MAETVLVTPQRSLELRRPWTDDASPLRAWAAADEMVLNDLGGQSLDRTLIVNDHFGALACGLAHVDPILWSDSALSRAAIDANLAANNLPLPTPERLVRGHELPSGLFDTVVVNIPKSLALLNHQLAAIASCTKPGARIVGAAMDRHLSSSTYQAFERTLGPAARSRGWRKARLIHVTRSAGDRSPPSLEATVFDANGVLVAELPGVFSAGRVDAGTALLVEQLSGIAAPNRVAQVADLGCGNGVLAVAAGRRWSNAQLTLRDVSDLAVASAQHTMELNGLADRSAVSVGDGLAGTPSGSIDVVVTNPPFHQGHALDPDLTDRLLADASRVLRPSGIAYVVVQRHLQLHTRMRRWFSEISVASGHPTHVVLIASGGRR